MSAPRKQAAPKARAQRAMDLFAKRREKPQADYRVAVTITKDCRTRMEVAMVKRGIGDRELARLTGSSTATVCRLRVGITKDPFYSLAIRIARVLGCDPAKLWPVP